LPTGLTVLWCIYQTLAELQAAGRRVGLDDDGRVWVSPAVHPDCLFLLDSNAGDVAKLLANDEGATIH
jgi:hypothetical protein